MPRAATKATKSTEKKANKSSKVNGNGTDDSTAPAVEPDANISKIHSLVRESGGIAKVTLGDIRDELGHARLGVTVLQNMGEFLKSEGLGYMPSWALDDNAEPRQWQEVYVYERDDTVKSIILDAVADPDNHDLVSALSVLGSESPDYASMDAEQKMALVKAIICS